MKRRTVLVGLGGITAGTGALLGSGAFTTVEAERIVTVETAGDADAFLGLQIRSDLADQESDLIQFNFDNAGEGASGFNLETRTVLQRVLLVENNGTQDAIGIDIENVTIDPETGNEFDGEPAEDVFSLAPNPGEFQSVDGPIQAEPADETGQILDAGEATAFDLELDLRSSQLDGPAQSFADSLHADSTFDVTFTIIAGTDIEPGGNGDDDETPPVQQLTVETRTPTDVSDDSAILQGDLTEVSGVDDVDIFFEWREVGAESWETTDVQTRSTVGEFSDEIGELTDNTQYEFRAVADTDTESDTGTIETFTTTPASELNLRIDDLTQVDEGSPRFYVSYDATGLADEASITVDTESWNDFDGEGTISDERGGVLLEREWGSEDTFDIQVEAFENGSLVEEQTISVTADTANPSENTDLGTPESAVLDDSTITDLSDTETDDVSFEFSYDVAENESFSEVGLYVQGGEQGTSYAEELRSEFEGEEIVVGGEYGAGEEYKVAILVFDSDGVVVDTRIEQTAADGSGILE